MTALVQAKPAGALTSSVQSVTVTPSASSTAKTLLVAFVNFKSATATITAPTNWVQRAIIQAQGETLVAFDYEDNPGSLASFLFSTTAAAGAMSAIVMEFSGAEVASVDVTANNNGSSTAPDSGTTATTAQANEIWVGALGYGSAATRTISAITNGFTGDATNQIADASNAGATNGAHTSSYYKIVSSTGTPDVGVTLNSTSSWVGLMLAYKLLATSSRTISLSAPLGSTLSRSIPLTGPLQSQGLSRPIPLTGPLQSLALSRPIPLTAPLQSTALSRAITLTAPLMSGGLSRPIPLSAPLQSTALARIIALTTPLGSTLSRAIPLTASLAITRNRSIPLTAPLAVQTPPPPVPIRFIVRDGKITFKVR